MIPAATSASDPLKDAMGAIFEVTREPLLLVDLANRAILRANAAAAALYGQTASTLIDRDITTLVVKPEQLVQAFAARRERIPLSYHHAADGRHLPVEVFLSYLDLDTGTLCMIALRDLSGLHANVRAMKAAERKYESIFGAAPFPLLIINARHEIVDANPAALALYELDAAELTARPRFGRLLAERGRIHDYLQPGTQQIAAHLHRRKDGSTFMAEATVAFSRNKRSSRWIAVIRDITATHRAQEDLRISEERWRFALEGPGAGVFEWNPETDAFYVSQQFCEMLQLPEGSEHDFDWWESRLHPDDLLRTNEAILAHLTQATPRIDLDIRVRNGADAYHWVELRAMAMDRDASGRTHRVIGTARIIDAEREREQRERDQASQLLHLDRLASMGEMATLIAHELNQPLAAIGNFAAAAHHRLADDPQEARRALELIQALVQRAGGIVQQVRGFANKKTSPRVPIDLNAVVIEIVRFIEYRAQAEETRIHTALSGSLPPLRADSVQIGQLILNLVKNGLDAMRGMPAPRCLTLRTEPAEAGCVRFMVEDCGCGLPVELQDSLYQPFFSTKPDGLGMGLSICRSIVENHGGSLHAEANSPQGTRFVATLPLA